ncbi:TPA: DUF859 family phage minor structural protein [Streptococcus suis]
MAKFSSASGSLYLNVYIEPSAQNIANNTTLVNWRMTVSRTGAYYTYNENGDSTLSLDLNGSRVHSSNPRWHTSGEEFQMASGSTMVGHNADGTKSFGFSATFNPNNGLHGVITVSGNIKLATIPRSSSISFSTGTIGSPLAITINRASTSFTHTLRWAWGSRSGTIASGLTTSASWTIPMDFCNELPNNVSGSGTIYVDTYSGSTKLGTQSKQFTANVPSSVIPSFTGITLDDQNAIAKALITGNTFVQIMSDIKVTFNGAAGIYNSTIKGFRAEVLNKNIILTSNGGTLGPMNFNGTATIRASVTDSRGRVSATKDVTITLLEYYAPVISIQVLRTRENPNKLQVLRTIKVAPLTFNNVNKNSTKLVFEVAKLGSTSFVADTGSAGGEWTTIFTLTNSEANLGGTYDSTSSWTVRAKLSDKFTSSNPTIASTNVGTETVINAYDKDGRFGVGKIPELGPAGSVDAAGNVYASDMFIAGKALRDIFYPIGSIFQSTDGADPSTFIGGTWERFGKGRVLVSVDENDSDFSTPNKTGGAKTHKLTAAEMEHKHVQTERFNSAYSNAAGHKFTLDESVASDEIKTSGVADVTNQAHNNLQPYIAVYMWRRTA